MGIKVTFTQTAVPAPDMTREQVIGWLTGAVTESKPFGLIAGMLASSGICSMVDGLKRRPGQAIAVKLRTGERWQLTCS